ncbi:MAG TPA: site-2 protease family protein, partial [Terriglobia bacterium]
IPPLDGSHVLAGILPDGIRQAYESVGQYGTLLLFALLWGTNLFGRIISPVLNFCDSLLMIGMT